MATPASQALPGARTALFFLFFVSMFNYLDRFVLSVLLPAIKKELLLSDTQLGAVGTAFTLSYVVLGIPLARLADRHSRKTIISISLAIWSAMTAACGLAQSFYQLALARVFVGVGEAGATPPAHSMISDYFPIANRTKALATFGLGAPIGLMVGFVVASWLAEDYGWRIAFLALGIPGVLLAVVVQYAVKEPQRGSSEAGSRSSEAEEVPSFWVAVKTLLSSPAYRHMGIATGLYVVVYLAIVSWLPSYFVRSFEMSLKQVGFWLAMSLGISQLIGMIACGFLTDVLVKRSARWYCFIPALAMLISSPLFILVFGSTNPVVATLALGPAFLIGIFQGPASFAAIQAVAHVRMRAMAVAVYLLITNLIGGTIGPFLTGWLSDAFVSSYGEDSLRWALMIVSVFFGLWAAVHYALGGRTIAQEIETHA